MRQGFGAAWWLGAYICFTYFVVELGRIFLVRKESTANCVCVILILILNPTHRIFRDVPAITSKEGRGASQLTTSPGRLGPTPTRPVRYHSRAIDRAIHLRYRPRPPRERDSFRGYLAAPAPPSAIAIQPRSTSHKILLIQNTSIATIKHAT